MYKPVQQCNHCGANLSLEDLRRPNCTYCGTVYPHHAQAAQHAAVAGQVMNQMMAQQAAVQDQWRAGFGVGPMPQGPPGGPPPGVPYAGYGGYGAPPPPPGMPGSPYGDPARMVAAQMAAANQLTNKVFLFVAIAVVGSLVLSGVIAALVLMR